MSIHTGSTRGDFRLLLDLDGHRLRSALRNPGAGPALGVIIPFLVLFSALWLLGRSSTAPGNDMSAALTRSLLVSGSIAFFSYGVIVGGADQRYLLRTGVPGGAIFRERGVRLLVAGIVTAIALVIPSLSAGADIRWPLAISLTSAAVAVAVAMLAYSWAARAASEPRLSILSAGMGQFDPGLAKAAPLVYAPLLPFLAGGGAGGIAAALGELVWLAPLVALALAAGAIQLAGRRFDAVAGRFMPRAAEMAFAPPPEKGGEAFRVGRGLSGLLPARAAAVWVRDATVAGRRFAWASRVTWPIALVSLVALARWGAVPSTRIWVLTAVGLALLVQSAAVVGLGLLEKDGRRWLDRSVGAGTASRFTGRWAWAWGLSLWLLIPVGLAWGWWGGDGPLWLWPLAGAGTALVSTSASLLNAERRR